MKKYGNKIIAILTTAVCLIGVLPLFCSAKTENVFVPPKAAITLDTRYSISAGGYTTKAGAGAITIPLPRDKDISVTISLNQDILCDARYFFLDSEFEYVAHYDVTNVTVNVIDLNEQYTDNAQFVVINVGTYSNWSRVLLVNDVQIEVVEGAYTNASLERYDIVEVPDDTEETHENGIVDNVLNMWQHILTDNLDSLEAFYNELTKPIALIIGIPICIAICSIIFITIGGKRR